MASLPVSAATRLSARQRRMSTTIEMRMTAKAKPPGSTSPGAPMRRSASAATPMESAKRKAVCASAAIASTFSWPKGWPSSAGLSAMPTAK